MLHLQKNIQNATLSLFSLCGYWFGIFFWRWKKFLRLSYLWLWVLQCNWGSHRISLELEYEIFVFFQRQQPISTIVFTNLLFRMNYLSDTNILTTKAKGWKICLMIYHLKKVWNEFLHIWTLIFSWYISSNRVCSYFFLEALNFVVSASLCKAVEPGGQGRGVDFGISVNTISTGVGRLCPTEYYLPLRIFRCSNGLTLRRCFICQCRIPIQNRLSCREFTFSGFISPNCSH